MLKNFPLLLKTGKKKKNIYCCKYSKPYISSSHVPSTSVKTSILLKQIIVIALKRFLLLSLAWNLSFDSLWQLTSH